MRGRVVLGGTILVLALVLAPVAPWEEPGARAAQAADCVWHRHSERIVRHVRRNGQIRRIVRIKHWWTCDPIPPPPARLGVHAFEFHFILSRARVTAGELILEMSNRGEDDHNLNLRREGSTEPLLQSQDIAPGQRWDARLTLAPGVYRLWCSLPQHEELGMSATLTVETAG
jgi:plastocyanin